MLFRRKNFLSHSGRNLTWKIDCDDLTDDDLECLAHVGQAMVPHFGSLTWIPTGGVRFAEFLCPYVSPTSPYRLIVDDVLTTGKSMEEARETEMDIGLVIFARSQPSEWIIPIFQLHKQVL